MHIRLPNIICLDQFPIENCWRIYNAMYYSHTSTVPTSKYSPFSVFTIPYPNATYKVFKPTGLNIISTDSVTKVDRILYNNKMDTNCENVSDKYSTFLIFGSIDLIDYLKKNNDIVNYKYLDNITTLSNYYDGLSNIRFNLHQSLIMIPEINHNLKLKKFEYNVRPFGPLWEAASVDNLEESFSIENNTAIDYLRYCNYLFNQLQNIDTYCPTYTFSEIQVPIIITIAKTDFSKLDYTNSYFLQVNNTTLQDAYKRSMSQNFALLKCYPECLWFKDTELESTVQQRPISRNNYINSSRITLESINWEEIETNIRSSPTSVANSF